MFSEFSRENAHKAGCAGKVRPQILHSPGEKSRVRLHEPAREVRGSGRVARGSNQPVALDTEADGGHLRGEFMPTYEYVCTECENHWEEVQKISEDPIKVCPKCTKSSAKRQISGGNFILKGGGWYADLYSSSPKKSESKSEGAAKSESTTKSESTSTSSGSTSGSTSGSSGSSGSSSTGSSGGSGSSGSSGSKT